MRQRGFLVTFVRVLLWLQVGFAAIAAGLFGYSDFTSATGAPQQAAAAAFALLVAIAPYVLARAWDELAWKPAGLRDCSRCAEPIRAAASVCRYCGTEQRPEESVPNTLQRSRALQIALAVALIVLVVLPYLAPIWVGTEFEAEMFDTARTVALVAGLVGGLALVLGFTWRQLGHRRANLALLIGAVAATIAAGWYNASLLLLPNYMR